MEKLKLVITDFISVNHYLAYRAIMKNGRPMAMSYKTQEATRFHKNFTQYVKQQAKEQNWITDPNPFQHYYVDAVFYFPRISFTILPILSKFFSISSARRICVLQRTKLCPSYFVAKYVSPER